MIIADLWKKNLVEENKIKKLKKSANEGDLEENRLFSGKEAEWMEKNLCRNTFPFEKKSHCLLLKARGSMSISL